MRTVGLVALFVLMWLALPPPADAHGPYGTNVREARAYARAHTTDRGWRCLDRLWDAESHWSARGVTPDGASPLRGAFGIPQAFPGRRMIRAIGWVNRYVGWRQVRWGLAYVRDRYGSACHARRYQVIHGWY